MTTNRSIQPDQNISELQVDKKNYLLLGFLFIIYTLSFANRQLIAIASPAIKIDLDLSDTQLGLLKGFTFVIFYSFLALPIARYADHKPRINIVTCALAICSLMTVVCSLTSSFLSFVAIRCGVGIGAAGITPAAHSMIYDVFKDKNLSLAMSVYALGVPLGSVVAFTIGGMFVSDFGWRMSFILFGLLGLIAALIFVLVVREPKRIVTSKKPIVEVSSGLLKTFTLLFNIPAYRIVCIGACFAVFGQAGMANWIVDFFHRRYGLVGTDINTTLAIIYGVCGCGGVLIGGLVADRLGKIDTAAYFKVPGLFLGSCSISVIAAIWTTNSDIALFFFSLTIFLMFSYFGPIYVLAQSLVPEHIRAFSTASLLLFMNLLGAGLGPLIIGMISDFFTTRLGEAVALSIGLSVVSLSSLAACYCFYFSSHKLHST